MMQVKNGDLDKLGLLFERYHRILFAFFYRLGNDKESSEDLVQNVFIRIMKYRKNFKGEGQFKHWMFHIARNIHADNYKKNTKLGIKEYLDSRSATMTDHDENVRQNEADFNLYLLKESMNQLGAEKKELLTLTKLDGMKYKEIGEMLDCSEGAVKVKVFRALHELREIFEKIKSTHG